GFPRRRPREFCPVSVQAALIVWRRTWAMAAAWRIAVVTVCGPGTAGRLLCRPLARAKALGTRRLAQYAGRCTPRPGRPARLVEGAGRPATGRSDRPRPAEQPGPGPGSGEPGRRTHLEWP